MRCSNPTCGKSIGLVRFKLSSLGNLTFHSKRCRESFKADRLKRVQQEQAKWEFWEWLKRPPRHPP